MGDTPGSTGTLPAIQDEYLQLMNRILSQVSTTARDIYTPGHYSGVADFFRKKGLDKVLL